MDDTTEKLKRAISDHNDLNELRGVLQAIVKSSPEYGGVRYFHQCFLREGATVATACREAFGFCENEFRMLCAAWAFAYFECDDREVTDLLMIVLDDEDDTSGETSMVLQPGFKRFYCPRTFKP